MNTENRNHTENTIEVSLRRGVIVAAGYVTKVVVEETIPARLPQTIDLLMHMYQQCGYMVIDQRGSDELNALREEVAQLRRQIAELSGGEQ